MSLFNQNLYIPGGYGSVITEANTNRNFGASVVAVVGPANGGPMNETQTFTSAEDAIKTLGYCTASDLLLTSWANGCGTIKFVRVGGTHPFTEIWMNDALTSPAGDSYDYTETLSRAYGQESLFETGAAQTDWLYLGSDTPFSTINFTITGAATFGGSGVAMEVQYYKTAGWTAVGVTDGTISSGNTMGASGIVSFTEPSDWVTTSPTLYGGNSSTNLYWVRVRLNNIPSSAPIVSMVVERKNASPAYGLLVDDYEHIGVQTGAASTTTLIDSNATFTAAANPVQVGDIVTNVSDGSTSVVVTVTSGTQLITTVLSGGTYNKYVPTNSLSLTLDAVATGTLDSATTTSITDAAVNFITAGVSPGDYVTASATTRLIVSVAANTITTNDFGLTPSGVYTISSRVRLYDASGATFQTNGVRPGDTVTNVTDGSTATVLSVPSETTILVDGLTGGSDNTFTDGDSYTIVSLGDSYTVDSPVEKAYLEALDWGTSGNTLSSEIYTEGSEIKVKITDGYVEEIYSVDATATDPLLSIITDINAGSLLVSATDLTSAVYDLPATMASRQFSGGSNGTAAAVDYIEGLVELLVEEDIGVVYSVESTTAINAALKSHVATAAGINYQLPRVAIIAKPDTENLIRVTPTLQTEASALAYDGRTSYLIQKATIPSITSSTGLYTSRVATAAAYAGRIAGTPAAQPITKKSLNVVSLDKIFSRAEKITLIQYGITVIDQNANGISVCRSITTSTGSTPYYELSVRRAVDNTEVTVRQTLADLYVGGVTEPGILTQIKATTEGLLDNLVGRPGLGGTLQAYRNVRVSYDTNDQTRVNVAYEVLPMYPINFIYTTMFVQTGFSFSL